MSCMGVAQNKVFSLLESSFSSMAFKMIKRPWTTIGLSILVCVFTLPGYFRFKFETESIKLWISESSDTRLNHDRIVSVFPPDTRHHTAILRAENVLSPDTLLALYNIHTRVSRIRTPSGLTWENMCRTVPVIKDLDTKPGEDITNGTYSRINSSTAMEASVNLYPHLYCTILESFESSCLSMSILELFTKTGYYNYTLISSLTTEDILNTINSLNTSGIFNTNRNFSQLLGGITRDATGRIIGAKATMMVFFTSVNTTEVKLNPISDGLEVTSATSLEFEEHLLLELLNHSTIPRTVEIIPNIQLSYGYLAHEAASKDVLVLVVGYCLLVLYLGLTVQRPLLVCAGIFLSILATFSSVAVGLAVGIPVNGVSYFLPCLLLGIGVDDMFIMTKIMDNINHDKEEKDIKNRMSLMMQRAGIAITVTSVTDICAFFSGAITIIPALRAFSIFSAIGIGFLYFLTTTLYTACLYLEERRRESEGTRSCCISNSNSRDISAGDNVSEATSTDSTKIQIRFWTEYGKLVAESRLVKVAVLGAGLSILGVAIWGNTMLTSEFNMELFINSDTYLHQYYQVENEYFPTAEKRVAIYFAEVNHTQEFWKIRKLLQEFETRREIIVEVENWTDDFLEYMYEYVLPIESNSTNSTQGTGERAGLEKRLSTEGLYFQEKTIQFLFSIKGSSMRSNFKLEGPKDVNCGGRNTIIFSKVYITQAKLDTSDKRVEAMHTVKQIIKESNISGKVFPMSRSFSNLETTSVIRTEIFRNMILAFVSVFIITFFFLVDMICATIVLLSVVLTLVNITGYMYFWDLSLTVISINLLTISVGLSIDFSAHIAYAYLTKQGMTRESKVLSAIQDVGPAVFHGGISTFIIFSPLAGSMGYVYNMMFKLMTMTILFGLFNGLAFVPVLLSIMGPLTNQINKTPDIDVRHNIERVATPVHNKGYVEELQLTEKSK